jgi:hypothetical protein
MGVPPHHAVPPRTRRSPAPPCGASSLWLCHRRPWIRPRRKGSSGGSVIAFWARGDSLTNAVFSKTLFQTGPPTPSRPGPLLWPSVYPCGPRLSKGLTPDVTHRWEFLWLTSWASFNHAPSSLAQAALSGGHVVSAARRRHSSARPSLGLDPAGQGRARLKRCRGPLRRSAERLR